MYFWPCRNRNKAATEVWKKHPLLMRLGCGSAVLKMSIYFFQSCQLLRNSVLPWWPSAWCTFWERALGGELWLSCRLWKKVCLWGLRLSAILSGLFKVVKQHHCHCFKCLLRCFPNLSNRKKRFPVDYSELLFQRQVTAQLILEMDVFVRLWCFTVREALKRRALLC